MNFTVDEPYIEGKPVVYAKDFGLSEDLPNNYSAFIKAVAYCKKTNAGILKIEEGIYHFKSDNYITFSEMEDFILDGGSAEFVFHSPFFFQFDKCRRVKAENLICDFSWDEFPLASLVKVVSNNQDEKILELLFYHCNYKKETLDISSFNQFDPHSFTPGVKSGKEIWVYPDSLVKKSEKGDVLQISYNLNEMTKMEAGEFYLARHVRNRDGCAFLINDCEHITIKNNTVYSTMGMTHMVAGESQFIRFDGERICIRPESNRFVSTDGDGIHIIQSKGHIIIENCDFSGMGDDDVNVHDCHLFVSSKKNEYTLLLENQGYGKKGDKIEIRRPDFSPFPEGLTLKDISVNTDGFYELSFDEKIPDGVGAEFILLNKRYQSSNYIIRNNYFHENRARGILLQCSNGLVENNLFYRTQGAAIYIMLEAFRGHWYEGSGVTGLEIKNNRFLECNCGDWTSNIDMMAVLPCNTSEHTPFEKIVIKDNSFENYLPPAMYLSGGKGILIKDNAFQSNDISCWHFVFERCKEVTIENNRMNSSVLDHKLIQYTDSFLTRKTLRLFAPMEEENVILEETV